MRLDRPFVVAAIAAAAVAMAPVQGLAVLRASQADLTATANAAALTATVEAPAAAPAPRREPDAAATRDRQAEQEAEQDPIDEAFAERWPAQAAATQDLEQPDTTRWALLIGINEHMGKVKDNVGSAQDAQELRQFLLAQGWRDDHIVLINDYDATYDNIVAGINWLAAKTDKDSVGIFHYSGHSKKWYDEDHDGDGEITDEGLWPTDDRFIVDSEFAARMGAVDAGRLWISIGACNSEGFNDAGLARPGRVLTFSSAETEKSYEDPSVDNSVYGYYFFDEGLLQGLGDTGGDGVLTVEETFNFFKPRASARTDGQRYGRQNAVIVDQLEGDFDFRIPPPPPEPEPEPTEDDAEAEQPPGLLCPFLCED